MRERTFVLLSALLASALAGPVALAQEPERQEEPELPRLENPFEEAPKPHEELARLFAKVELSLDRIDKLLYDASAGDTEALKDVGESGIDEILDAAPPGAAAAGPASGMSRLLRHTQSRGREVVEDIDRILEIAQKSGSTCSGSCCGDSSSIDEKQPGETQRQETQEGPQEGERPKPEESDGKDPKGNQASNARPESSPAAKQPDHETEGPQPTPSASDKWGELPVYARDLFRAEGGLDLPARYREWIEAYYRRLNSRSGR